MSAPSTPQKQAQPVKLEQLPTPPPTAVARKETTDLATHHFHEPGPHVRRLTYDAQGTQKVEKVDESSDPTLHDDDSVKQAHTQQLDENGRPLSEVKLWLSSPSNPDERRRRFDIFLHGLWPSNEKFNTARNPLYDPEEDGPYEFFLHQTWDGHCPWFDDDYDPNTDPSKSNDVWEPKIGEEGIENEQDIRMVLKAREEQRVRSEAFKERKAQVIAVQERAGIKYGDMDMLQVFLGPEIESNDADSDYRSESDNEEGDEISVPTVQISTQSTTTNSSLPGKPTLQPTITAKGIRVFGGQELSQSKGSKNKKGRKAKKRKRPNDNPNSTYKYNSASEDEKPLYKKAKKGKFAVGPVSGDSMWKAQTRSAARRAQHVGTDGTYEMD
ncbi:hypothetical protein F4860DRAFT_513417 [Xylaria cubensis]|nr:hypothetical protein F4860DRAFT_513417 [Xylaria cubensis]